MWYVFEMRESPLSFCFPNFLPFRWILLPHSYFDLAEYMTTNQLAIESSSALFCFLLFLVDKETALSFFFFAVLLPSSEEEGVSEGASHEVMGLHDSVTFQYSPLVDT